MYGTRTAIGGESEIRADLARCYVEEDTVEVNEQIERDTRRLQQNWVALGNGGFFTRPAPLSDFV